MLDIVNDLQILLPNLLNNIPRHSSWISQCSSYVLFTCGSPIAPTVIWSITVVMAEKSAAVKRLLFEAVMVATSDAISSCSVTLPVLCSKNYLINDP